MDLWIRSQDKKRLTKVEDLYLVHDDKQFCDYLGNNMVGHLAKYTNKGRALEVLDEIQMLLTPKMIIKNEGSECVALDGTIYRTNLVSNVNSDIQQLSTYVYQMPEELG